MKQHSLGIAAIVLSLFSIHAVAANATANAADNPVVKKKHVAADEEGKRAQTLQEFPQYNYPVATISKAEVVDSQVTESAGSVVDAQFASTPNAASEPAPAADASTTAPVNP